MDGTLVSPDLSPPLVRLFADVKANGGPKVFRKEETVSARVLRQEQAWHFQETET